MQKFATHLILHFDDGECILKLPPRENGCSSVYASYFWTLVSIMNALVISKLLKKPTKLLYDE
jgi:hypothetical protein